MKRSDPDCKPWISIDKNEINRSLRDLRHLGNNIYNLKADFRNASEEMLNEAASRVWTSMYANAPRASGKLAKSIVMSKVNSKGQGYINEQGITISVGEGLYRPYWFYQEKGYKSHVIPVSWVHGPYEGYKRYAANISPVTGRQGWDPSPYPKAGPYGSYNKGFATVQHGGTFFIRRAFQEGAKYMMEASAFKKRMKEAVKK